MLEHKHQITIRQLLIIMMMLTVSLSIRIVPRAAAYYGEVAGWTAPIVAVVPLFILFAVLNAFFKNKQAADLSGVFDLVLGKIGGKILLAVYLSWATVLFFLYTRYFAERLLETIYPNTNIKFFIFTILILVYIAARGNIETLARFSEISLFIFTFVFIFLFLIFTPSVKISNLLPLTYYDAWPAMRSGLTVFGVWCYVTVLFFFGEYVFNKEQLKKYTKKVAWFMVVMNTLLLITVIGSLSYISVQKMHVPLYNVVKAIEVMPSFNRFEAVLLSAWVVSDFILLTVFAMLVMQMTKKLFNASQAKYFASPVILLGYVGSLYLAIDIFQLEDFSSGFIVPGNLVLMFVVPILLLVIGKIRKKI